MAYSLSPGVTWSEIDLTTIVPAVATTEGAFAGDFDWGPINQIMTITNEDELVRWFGRPTSNVSRTSQAQSFFTAANFLAYGNNLKVIRAADTSVVKNATSGSLPILIKNQDDYEINYMNQQASDSSGMFAARYAGDLGNSLIVSLYSGSNNPAAYASWTYKNNFSGVPGTSAYAASKVSPGANDELHLLVLDANGKFGTANTVLERFSFLSKASDAKNDDGSSNYYIDVINKNSQYIYIINHALDSIGSTDTSTWGLIAEGTNFEQGATVYTAPLSGGVVASPTTGDVSNAYITFANSEEIDASLIMMGNSSVTSIQSTIQNVAEVRKDCVVFFSPAYADVVDNAGSEEVDIITTRNSISSSSYAVMDSGWKKQFDKYNNRYLWVPLNGDIAGLCARTDFERDAWFSPAGLNRGGIKNVTKLAWNPNKANRDNLYSNGINPVVTMKGEGTVLYGDKTLQTKPSAFDRINVRRLFIVLEKAISRAAKYSMFEFNDEFTRAQFVALVEPYLRDVKGRRGIFDFRVVCDTTNNTPEVIDRNEFIGDIYIKPARSINFIHLNFVAVRTGVAFSEVVGRF